MPGAKRTLHLFFPLLLLAGCLAGQERGGQDIRGARIEVQKYTIDANINPRTQSIEATAKIDLNPLESANEATFELNPALNVSKAVDGKGAAAQATRNPDGSLRVVFPSGLQKGQPTTLVLSYDGKITGEEDSPVPGIKFAALHPDFGYLMYPSRWFPISGYSTNR